MKRLVALGALAVAMAEGATVSDAVIIPVPREMAATGGECRLEGEPVFVRDASLPPEGYEISIAPAGVTIRHADDAGAYYAKVTLSHMGRRERGGKVAIYPCVEIKDSPRFRWRGVQFDDVRHFFGKETVKRTLDLMARYKLNVFHWHLTDHEAWLVDIPGYPGLVKQGRGKDYGEAVGPFRYTDGDIREIVEYAAARHITVVPEIEFPGHFSAVLRAYPSFGCPSGGRALCVGNPEAIAFLEKAIDRICELFPSEYVHIGGDECRRTWWKACPKCQVFIKEHNLKNEDGLQQWLTRHFTVYLAAKGRRTIGWDEIFADPDPLPKATIGMCWRPETGGHEGAGAGAKAANDGYEIVMCPWSHCYFDYAQGVRDDPYAYNGTGSKRVTTLEKVYSFDPLAGVDAAARKFVIGSQCNNWSEKTLDRTMLDWKMWPRTLALAEVLWTYPDPDRRDFAEFARRVAEHRHRMIRSHVNCAPLK